MSEIIVCLWCGEVFTGDELANAQAIAYFTAEGHRTRYFHHECGFRTAMGSLAHMQRRCSCYGGSEDDPPGMTKRQAAQAALEAYLRRQGAPS